MFVDEYKDKLRDIKAEFLDGLLMSDYSTYERIKYLNDLEFYGFHYYTAPLGEEFEHIFIKEIKEKRPNDKFFHVSSEFEEENRYENIRYFHTLENIKDDFEYEKKRDIQDTDMIKILYYMSDKKKIYYEVTWKELLESTFNFMINHKVIGYYNDW